jgi:xanthosine utilization system XapX-like protein
MVLVPEMTNEGTSAPGEPFVFPSYGNIGPPHIAILSLLGLTIGLSVWLFSTQVIQNAVSASVVSTSPQEHQPHVDPSPSSPVRSSSPSSLAKSPSVSSSSSSESSTASNSVNKKKKKRKNKKKKNKKGSKLPTTVKHVGKQPVTLNRVGSVDDLKITQTTRKPKYPCRLCKGSHLLKDFPGLSKVVEAWSTRPHQPMLLASEQHADDPPSTSHDTIGKKKSRVKFPCMLCKGSHLTHICPHLYEASKFLEDMTISQPQLSADYLKLSLNPPIVDGMINPVPLSVSPVDQVVNLVTSWDEPIDQVVDPIPSLVNPTIPLENETQAVDLLPPVDRILPLENENQVVDLISPLVDPTLPLESKPDTSHVFIVDTDSAMSRGIPPSPMEPPPSNEAIHFDWGVLTGPRLPSTFLSRLQYRFVVGTLPKC